jgi:16S rRNA (uracil1498-N3)-methyltransferase
MENFKLKRVSLEDSLYSDAIIKIISKEKIHHLTIVLKIKPEENIRLFNKIDGEWIGEILEINKKYILITVKEHLRKEGPSNNISIAFAPIKLDRLRFLIEKSTELGTGEFIPVITQRTISRDIKPDKLYAYALSAAEQSERLSVPEIKEPVSLEKFLLSYPDAHILFCNERSDSSSIRSVLQTIQNNSQIIILIGPEGGFTLQEKDLLIARKNIHSVSLGDNILRAETAAIFALSCVICITKLN